MYMCSASLSEKEEKKNMNKITFCLVAGLLPWQCFQAIQTFLLARVELEDGRYVLESA